MSLAFVSGASMANTAALAAARDHQLARAGWDVQADGLFGAPELTVIIGEKAHSTVVKALRSVRDFARKEWPLRGSPADVSCRGVLRSAGG